MGQGFAGQKSALCLAAGPSPLKWPCWRGWSRVAPPRCLGMLTRSPRLGRLCWWGFIRLPARGSCWCLAFACIDIYPSDRLSFPEGFLGLIFSFPMSWAQGCNSKSFFLFYSPRVGQKTAFPIAVFNKVQIYNVSNASDVSFNSSCVFGSSIIPVFAFPYSP